MSKFSFTGPNGEVYDVEGPSGATVEQAKAVFNQQISSGGLTGIPIGGLVNAVTQATGGLSSAIAKIGPASFAQALQLGNIINLPDLRGLPIPNPIGVSDFVKTAVGQQGIGSISPVQIQGLIAQTGVSVGQAVTAITDSKGLGKFGFNADQLQLSGLIKPGLAEQINLDPSKFTSILSSPTSWTGKLGATDLNSVLGNESLQTTVQQGLMKVNFDQLKQIGVINGTEVASQLGPLLNTATKFGLGNATAWLNTAPTLGSVGSLVSGSGISGLLNGSGVGSLLNGEGAGSLLNGSGISGLLNGSGVGSLLNSSGVGSLLGGGGVGSLLNGGGIGSLLSGGGVSSLLSGSGVSSLLSSGGVGSLLSGSGIGGIIGNMNNFAKSAEFAQSFSGLLSSGGISGLLSGGGISSLLSGGGIGSLLSGGGIGSLLSGGGISGLLSGGGIGGLLSGGFGGFGDSGGNPLEAGVQAAKGFTNTVNRSNLNEAVRKVIGNSKISVPDFAPQVTG